MYIYSFYNFKNLKNLKNLKLNLLAALDNKVILGTILLANEGVNGTISGNKKDLDEFIINLKNYLRISSISLKISKNDFIPFYRMKIKIKKEIVALGNEFINPCKKKGKYISPQDWDDILNDEKYLIIDTRNDYEVNIGSFMNTHNPRIKSFREFPSYIENLNISKNKPIAMFCTGGIRCEKASSYLIEHGYKDVSQLDGGILNYLNFKKDKKTSKWNGECFVFDNRVAVNNELKKGSYDQCYGCRHPITEKDKKMKSYKKGISCRFCVKKLTLEKVKSSETRQKQIDAAELNRKDHSFKKIYV